jgi:hypothetical protein
VWLGEQTSRDFVAKTSRVNVLFISDVVDPSEAFLVPKQNPEAEFSDIRVGIYFELDSSALAVDQKGSNQPIFAMEADFGPSRIAPDMLARRDGVVDHPYNGFVRHKAKLCRTVS